MSDKSTGANRVPGLFTQCVCSMTRTFYVDWNFTFIHSARCLCRRFYPNYNINQDTVSPSEPLRVRTTNFNEINSNTSLWDVLTVSGTYNSLVQCLHESLKLGDSDSVSFLLWVPNHWWQCVYRGQWGKMKSTYSQGNMRLVKLMHTTQV